MDISWHYFKGNYEFSERKKYSNPVLFWRGSEEPIPAKSEKNLKKILPHIKVEVFEGLGYGQFLHERPKEYGDRLKKFMNVKN